MLGVDRDHRESAGSHMGHLRFLVIGDHPDVGQRHQQEDPGSDAKVLASLDETLADKGRLSFVHVGLLTSQTHEAHCLIPQSAADS